MFKIIKRTYLCIVKSKKTVMELKITNKDEALSAMEKLKDFIKNGDKPKNIMERVKSFEDACEVKGLMVEDVLPYITPTTKQQIRLNDVVMLDTIQEVLNEGWEADYGDSGQRKHYAYFRFDDASGRFVFWHTLCEYDSSSSTDGARRVFKTEALAIHFGEQFIEIHSRTLLK